MNLNESIHLLLIEDEDYDVKRIRNTLRPFEKNIHIREVVSDGRMAVELLEKDHRLYDVVIMDFQIMGGLRGESLIRRIKEIDPTLQIIVVTKMTVNITDFEFANKLIEAGAMWYCTKYPGDIEEYIYQPTDFILNILNAYEKKKLEKDRLRSNRRLQESIANILERKRIIGDSAPIQKLREQIETCAQNEANVLIRGASGTGKELVATNIHYLGKRRFENFVPINCGSLPTNLIESELFGFERGSFTGANVQKKGLFEVAHKGTIFLDEVTELPLSAQSKLLRVIQEGEIDKIGRTGPVRVDVRIIAATNKNLEQEVKKGHFREDLYYRLNVVSLTVPSLAERRSDIPLLVDYFLRYFSASMGTRLPVIEKEALQVLTHYAWPGNVRELQNVVQRLLLMRSEEVRATQVKSALGLLDTDVVSSHSQPWKEWSPQNMVTWREMEQRIQREYFQFVRKNTQSDAEAARILGLAPPNYHRMCKRLGLK